MSIIIIIIIIALTLEFTNRTGVLNECTIVYNYEYIGTKTIHYVHYKIVFTTN